MERLTTDQPLGIMQTCLNLFYAKDGEAWVRDGGAGPLHKDVRLFDFIREAIRANVDEERTFVADFSDEELGDVMVDWLADGNTSVEGLIGTLYTAAWAFAEIRARLKHYEDTGLEQEQIINARETLACFDNIGIKRGNKIVTAEQEGRLVVLPCKVGDTVWTNRSVKGDYLRDKDRPYLCDVVFIGLSDTPFIHVVLPNGRMLNFFFEDIGKTVFLTREEAEAALEAQKGGDGNG